MAPPDMFVKDPVINVSVTLPVNSPGNTDVLTFDDVWAGLLHQQRYAQDYVPHITHVEITEKNVLSDTTTSYKRTTHLSQEAYPNTPPLVQDVIVVDKLKIDSYTHTNNTLATATISVGQTDGDIYYSLSYERPAPGISADSSEVEKMRQDFIEMARKNVASCIDLTRKYKAEGRYEGMGRFI